MKTLDRFALRRPLAFALLVTVAFIVALFVILALTPRAAGERAIELAGALGRFTIAALACVLAAGLGWWRAAGFTPPSRTGRWLLVFPPLLYLAAAFALLTTGRFTLPASPPATLALVGLNGLAAGVLEEIVFRGIVLYALVRAWGESPGGRTKAVLVSSLLFSLPHALNLLAGADPLRTAAQLVWALELGVAFGAIVLATGSVWPAALLHGLANAYLHANRHGMAAEPGLAAALLMALAPVPVVLYAVLLAWRSWNQARGAVSPPPV